MTDVAPCGCLAAKFDSCSILLSSVHTVLVNILRCVRLYHKMKIIIICPCPGPWGSGHCPYPGPCGLVLVLVLVFSPCKNLFPLFHYSDLFAYYCSVNAYN